MQRFLYITLIFVFSQNAFAVVEAEIFYGQTKIEPQEDEDDASNSEEDESDEADQSTDMGLAVHVPLTFGPFSFGLLGMQRTMTDEDEGTKSTLTGSLYGLELKAWVPMTPKIKPYLRAAYLSGQYDMHAEGEILTLDVEIDAKFKSTGYRAGVGFQASIYALSYFFLEYAMGQETLKFDSGEMSIGNATAAIPDDNADDLKWKTSGWTVGLGIGF